MGVDENVTRGAWRSNVGWLVCGYAIFFCVGATAMLCLWMSFCVGAQVGQKGGEKAKGHPAYYIDAAVLSVHSLLVRPPA